MKRMFSRIVIAALVSAPLFAGPASAQVAPYSGSAIAASKPAAPTEVRWHGYHRGWHRGGYYGRGYYGRGYYGRGYGYRRGVGAGIAGLAAGAIIGGAIASQANRSDDNSVAYCERRFKSYDPSSGTYLGYDGDRHPCP